MIKVKVEITRVLNMAQATVTRNVRMMSNLSTVRQISKTGILQPQLVEWAPAVQRWISGKQTLTPQHLLYILVLTQDSIRAVTVQVVGMVLNATMVHVIKMVAILILTDQARQTSSVLVPTLPSILLSHSLL